MTETTTEVRISRYFDAPPEMVYRAFTEADQLVQWFAPLAFHVPRDSVDLDVRPGGHWTCTMVNNFDGSTAPMTTHFVEVVENQLLVGYDIADGFPGLPDGTRISLSIEFVPEGAGTRLELRQSPMLGIGAEMARVGWAQALFKLEALLATPIQFRSAQTPEEAS